MAKITVQPGGYTYIRFRPPRGFAFTVNLLCTRGEVWAMGLTAAGFDAFLKGQIPPPAVSSVGASLGTLFGQSRLQGVLFSTPPIHSFGKSINVMGMTIEGYWFLVLGNSGTAPISVDYEVWS